MKGIRFLCVTTFTLYSGSAGVRAQTVALWLFDDPPGSSVAVDSGGNDYHLTLGPDAAIVAAGRFGNALGANALTTDALGAHRDRVEAALNPGDADWTMECWLKLKPDISPDWDRIWGLWHDSSASSFLDYGNEGVVQHNIYNNNQRLILPPPGEPDLNDGLWHHIALSYDGGANSIRYHIDGRLEAQANITWQNTPEPAQLQVGMRQHEAGGDLFRNLEGYIDEMRFSSAVVYPADDFMPPESLANPFLSVFPVRLSFTAPLGGVNPLAQTLRIMPALAPLDWSIDTAALPPWLSIDPSSGLGVDGPTDVGVRVEISQLSEGPYESTLSIEAPGASNSPIAVLVSLEIYNPVSIWPIGNRKQLFIDHRFIDASSSVALTVNPPVKHPEPILVSDRPWDAFRLIWYSVQDDNGVAKIWYQAFDGDQWAEGRSRLCYAISENGLNWEKPSLGLIEYQGSTGNNIIHDNMINASVFIDPVAAPDQRYKMVYDVVGADWQDKRVATSADGIHWNYPDVTLSTHSVDTQSIAFWDTRVNRYVLFMRNLIDGGGNSPYPHVDPIKSNPPVVAPNLLRPVRSVGRLEMDDITAPWPMQDFRLVLAADEFDPPDSDIYTHGPYQYPYADDAYFLFPLTYHHFVGGETTVGNDGLNDCQFAASRDGVHWMRYGRGSYLKRGIEGDPDMGTVQPTGYHIRRGHYLYHYFMSWPYTHGGFRALPEEVRRDPEQSWGRELYWVAKQRLDGFVSVDVPYGGGWLVTPPLLFEGERLELNIDVDAMGMGLVEIQDRAGEPIPGYSLNDCDRILMNDVHHVVKWGGASDVSSLESHPVRLKIFLRSAQLFAFQFVSDDEAQAAARGWISYQGEK